MGSRATTVRRPTIAILLLLVIVLSSTTLYYNFAMANVNAKVSSLQTLAADLQSRNDELRERLLSLAQSRENATVSSLNPVWIYKSSNRSVVRIQGLRTVIESHGISPERVVENVFGSGFVVEYSNSYYVVTNFHVVDATDNVTVTFWNGDSYGGKVIGVDPYSDIAVLSTKASKSDLHPLDLASSSALRVGQPVVAIGNPFGPSGSVAFGIVSKLGGTIQYQSTTSSFSMADVIQFSASIDPRNSGGPLLDAYGFVVGITSINSQGVTFAVPSDTILRELPSLIRTGRYDQHPYFGFQGDDMNYQLAQAMGTNITYGVLIEKLDPGGPAEKAGLKGGLHTFTFGPRQYLLGGDIIVSLNGTRIVDYDSFATYLEKYAVPGQTVQVGIIRSGSPVVVSVVVGTLPSQ